MLKVNAKRARNNFSSLLSKVQHGEEVLIERRGQVAALLTFPKQKKVRTLPSLSDFRASIQVKGGALSKTVIDSRKGARY